MACFHFFHIEASPAQAIQTMPLSVLPFLYQSREQAMVLHCDQVPFSALVETYGTPLYVYSARAIREQFQILDRAFGDIPRTLCYSVKANSTLGILRLLAGLGSGFDVVSGGELARVAKADSTAARKVVFSGVGKTSSEMDAALAADILMFNVESESELRELASRATLQNKTARIAIRVNPDVSADTHPYISTGLREHKFGVSVPQAKQLYKMAKAYSQLEVTGVSVHIGSQIKDLGPFSAAMNEVAVLVEVLQAEGHRIRYIDAGGGLGIDYARTGSWNFQVIAADYARAVMEPLRSLKVHLLLEPGRSIVARSGVLLTRILYIKQNGEKRFAVVDAAMNDLLRPSLYRAFHAIVPVKANNLNKNEIYDVVGPVCESGDFFAHDRELPVLTEGEYLAILDAGSYGMSLSSNYNSRFRAAEVMVDGESASLIRHRETMADLLRLET